MLIVCQRDSAAMPEILEKSPLNPPGKWLWSRRWRNLNGFQKGSSAFDCYFPLVAVEFYVSIHVVQTDFFCWSFTVKNVIQKEYHPWIYDIEMPIHAQEFSRQLNVRCMSYASLSVTCTNTFPGN